MNHPYKNVFSIKVSLLETNPLVWRKIEISESATFYDLHVALQDAMGWWDYHLFQFHIGKGKNALKIGVPDPDFEMGCETAWEISLKEICQPGLNKIIYEYDFGDSWDHLIEIEGFYPKTKGTRYPQCLDGENTCPPEDCGGVWGFEEFKSAMFDTTHEQHDMFKKWFGKKFDPSVFNKAKVKFRNPTIALKKRLEQNSM